MTVMCNPRKNKVDLFIYLFIYLFRIAHPSLFITGNQNGITIVGEERSVTKDLTFYTSLLTS